MSLIQPVEPLRAEYITTPRFLFRANFPKLGRLIRFSVVLGLAAIFIPDILDGSLWALSDWEGLRALLLKNAAIALVCLMVLLPVIGLAFAGLAMWLYLRLDPAHRRLSVEIDPVGIALSDGEGSRAFSPWSAIRRVVQSKDDYWFERAAGPPIVVPSGVFSPMQQESLQAMIRGAGVPAELR